ncbi:hypothetical protein CTKZ_30140 [Cellulomonas algicola]|uniref:Bacterial Ig-like domain-containing protein n=1 Tax=Cellulomonas algicola TaxID=2071633 RepID=A0A401V3H2_9CELL|nr:Ig-like domain-containing protein [Cellulomonas algicola]GCD21452.1 hypothetical protein CTKZ_30140 [Cellulomonas algicola]
MLRPSLPRRLRAVATTAALVLAAAVGLSAPASAVPDGYPVADVPATGAVQTTIPVTVVCPFVEDQPWTIASWVTSEGSGILKTAHGVLADAQMVYSGSVWFSSPAPAGYVDVRCGYEDGDGRETWVSSGRFPISVAAPVVATTTAVAVAPSVTLPATLPAVATVATSGGAVTTGSVQFSVDGVDVGAPVAVDAHGEARTDLGAPAPGHRSVSARYLGASGLATSASAGSPVHVLAEAGVTLTLPTTATDAAPVLLRADVTGTDGLAAPGGTVAFTWDDDSLGSAPVVSGVAELTLPLPAGTFTGVTATYSGDGVHGGATSAAQTLVVAEHVAPRPVVTVDVPSTVVAGPVTATVTVVGPHSEAVTPEGDVQLIVLDADEHYLLHVNATLVDGSVEVTTPALAAGSYTVLAHYSGSSTQGVYAQADSTYHALTVTVPVVTPDPQPSAPTPTPTPVVPTPAPVPALAGSTSSTTPGGSVTLVARGFLPGETVQFHLHSEPVLLGTAVADASGVATLVTAVPAGTAAGLHHVVATGTTSQRTAQIELTVAAAGTSSGTRLASTGADPAGLLGLVAALLVAGAAMVAAPRVRARR